MKDMTMQIRYSRTNDYFVIAIKGRAVRFLTEADLFKHGGIVSENTVTLIDELKSTGATLTIS